MTAVGFEPTPLRTGALSQRLRPLGQTVLPVVHVCVRVRVRVLVCVCSVFLFVWVCQPPNVTPQSDIDSCGVRTHALADWRLEPAP